jgi:hypothetical protein
MSPGAGKALRQLFLTLFLRGRSSRGLRKSEAPKSVGTKLGLTLALYALIGCLAFLLRSPSVFALSTTLHSMTFLLLGMFVAASGGEVLFNKEEADILLHRPVLPRTLLWAKIRVLVEVSLWLSGALNLATFFVGMNVPGGGWLFPIAHALSIAFEALFCTSCVVLVYQLCLRWFGRERLDGLMTTAQVFVAVAAAMGGQVVPHLMARFQGKLELGMKSWWAALLPPVWFAAWDDALTGNGTIGSWALAALGLVVTSALLWIAFGKLAGDYERGLQTLLESGTAPRRAKAVRRWIDSWVNAPPLRWWLRDSVARASFLLTTAYLFRDRDMKLRMYPGLAPMLGMPLVFMLGPGGRSGSTLGMAFAGSFLGLVPLIGLSVIRYSQQWQASDVFRVAPMMGPAQLCHGARRAVLLLLTLPIGVLFFVIAAVLSPRGSDLLLMLPGALTIPAYAMLACLGGKAVPMSQPNEDAKAADRGLMMIGVMLSSFAIAGLGAWARLDGWFWWLIPVEAILVVGLYIVVRARLATVAWASAE